MTIGVAVIGAGMAGRAHAAAYRTAPTLYQSSLPPLRFVSIGDVSPEFGSLAARRFGYERSTTPRGRRSPRPTTSTSSASWWPTRCTARWWRACWPPASTCSARSRSATPWRTPAPWPTRPPARQPWPGSASPSAGHRASPPSASSSPGPVGPGPARQRPLLVRLRERPARARSAGATGAHPGSGALADIGSHAAYLAEFFCGDVRPSAAAGSPRRSRTPGAAGRGDRPRQRSRQRHVRAGRERRLRQLQRPVRERRRRREVSRVAAGHPNGLSFEVFGDQGAAKWDQERPAEIQLMLNEGRQRRSAATDT